MNKSMIQTRLYFEFTEDWQHHPNRLPFFGDLGVDKVFPNILCSRTKGLFVPTVSEKTPLQISDNPLKGNTEYW
jgi:hypothetical protein